MSEHVLGIKVAQPGGRVYTVKPHLGDLNWAEGTFPTPYGQIYVKHVKEHGRIKTVIKAPKEVKIIQT